MEEYLAWAIIGLTLVIVELLTGTFYLVVLGIAAFGAAFAAYFGQELPVQAMIGAAIAGAGCYGVHAYRARSAGQQMAPVDAGQRASFESWIDEASALARVHYRGASWDARVEGAASLEPGTVLYVLATEGNLLKVSSRRPQ